MSPHRSFSCAWFYCSSGVCEFRDDLTDTKHTPDPSEVVSWRVCVGFAHHPDVVPTGVPIAIVAHDRDVRSVFRGQKQRRLSEDVPEQAACPNRGCKHLCCTSGSRFTGRPPDIRWHPLHYGGENVPAWLSHLCVFRSRL